MSDIFRFVAVRPPQLAADKDVSGILVRTHATADEQGGLYRAIADGRAAGNWGSAIGAARAFVGSERFVAELSTLETRLDALDAFLRDARDRPTPAALNTEIKRVTDRDAATVAGGGTFAADRARLADSILAIVVSHDATMAVRHRLHRALVVAALLERMAAKAPEAASAEAIHDFLRAAVVLLPVELFTPAEVSPSAGNLQSAGRPRRNVPLRRGEAQAAAVAPDPEAELAVIEGALLDLRREIARAPSRMATTAAASVTAGGPDVAAARPLVPGAPGEPSQPRSLAAGPAGVPARAGWTLPAARMTRLDRSTRAVVAADASDDDVDLVAAIDRLERRAADVGARATAARLADRSRPGVVTLGSGVVDLGSPSGEVSSSSSAATATTFGTGATLARQPAIADLMVVRQEIKRYELGEVAHIENVLSGERMVRVHRTSSTVEDTVVTESSHAEELELDSQTTTRFEMSREMASSVSEDIKLDAGVRVAGSYGPVSLTASVGFAYSHSKEESEQSSTSFARETSERARSRVEDNVRDLQMRRTTTTVGETNRHEIDNKDQTGPVVGLYRWVDKIYEAQVVNYGRRVLVEFVIPEPAAFFLEALQAKPPEGVSLDRPEPPVAPGGTPLSPSDITNANYLAYVREYQVADAAPPPRAFTTVGLAWDEPWAQNAPDPATPAKLLYKARKEIKIPPGYKAAQVAGVVYASAWLMDTYLAVGATPLRGAPAGGVGESMPWAFTANLAGEEGDLPIALTIVNAWGYAISLEILCERTDEAFVRWQLKTFEAVMRAYYELRAAYDAQVAAAATRAGVLIAGRNPLENRAIERTELRRTAIELLTGQRFDAFGAVSSLAPYDYPEIDFAAAALEGPIVQFFEQAFEWQQMTYSFYPYYWGRKGGWLDTWQVSDPDPVFLGFLRAGYARVVAPVRPGFEQAIDLYLATGDIWNGSQAPQVNDPLYVSIIQEIQEQLQAPVTGTAVGDPWEVRLPTTLVMLQEDATLPTWP